MSILFEASVMHGVAQIEVTVDTPFGYSWQLFSASLDELLRLHKSYVVGDSIAPNKDDILIDFKADEFNLELSSDEIGIGIKSGGSVTIKKVNEDFMQFVKDILAAEPLSNVTFGIE